MGVTRILKTLIISLEPAGKVCILDLLTREGKLYKCKEVQLFPLYNDIRPITAAEDKYVVDWLPYYIYCILIVTVLKTFTRVTQMSKKIIQITDEKISFKIFKTYAKQAISIKYKKKSENCYCVSTEILI